jgi:hypothetical protein
MTMIEIALFSRHNMFAFVTVPASPHNLRVPVLHKYSNNKQIRPLLFAFVHRPSLTPWILVHTYYTYIPTARKYK